jgi:hypothetical protein
MYFTSQNILYLWLICTAGSKKKMPDAKSEKETWRKCTIHPFVREFIEAISSAQMLAANDWHVFFSKKRL